MFVEAGLEKDWTVLLVTCFHALHVIISYNN